jgi:hypothetical protein
MTRERPSGEQFFARQSCGPAAASMARPLSALAEGDRYLMIGGLGVDLSSTTQDERSKSMNTSAFS